MKPISNAALPEIQLKDLFQLIKIEFCFTKMKHFINLTIDEIIEKLESGLFDNEHFLPQSFFLGNNLDYFNIIGEVENLSLFEKKINNFFW